MDSQELDNTTIGQVALRQPSAFRLVSDVSVVVSACTMTLNIIMLVYIKRLAKLKENIFLVQLLFVCINDLGYGLCLFIMAVMRVSNYSDAIVCAAAIALLSSFDYSSKGNILCICLQRYICARNIRSLQSVWKRSHTVALTLTSTLVGLLIGISVTATSTVVAPRYPDSICAVVTNFKRYMHPMLGVAYLLGSILCLLVADLIGVLTILTLGRSKAVVGTISIDTGTATVETGPGQTGETRPGGARARQKHASITILFILITLHLSFVIVAVSVILNFLDMGMSPLVARPLSLFSTLPSLLHPLLIACRMQDLRLLVRSDMRRLCRRITNCIVTV